EPADVARRRVELGVQVESTEDEPLMGCVEGGESLRGLEDHRVALDETTLVAQPGAVVPLTGEVLGAAGSRLEPGLDPVDETLLCSDLSGVEVGLLVFGHALSA